MKIISSYPILNNNQVINPENSFTVVDSSEDVDYSNYCNADADSDYSNVKGKKNKPASNEKGKAKAKPTAAQKGALGKKVLGGLDKAKESGLTDSLKNLGRGIIDKNKGKITTDTTGTADPAESNSLEPESVSEGMSKNTKIAIGVVSGVVALGIIYFVFIKK